MLNIFAFDIQCYLTTCDSVAIAIVISAKVAVIPSINSTHRENRIMCLQYSLVHKDFSIIN